MSNDQNEPEWISKAEAAAQFHVPLRTIQAKAKARALRSKGRLVAAADVAALAEARQDAAAGAQGASAALASRQPLRELARGCARPGDQTGDQAGRIFALFDEGVAPAEVVRRERLLPQVVLALHRDYIALKELGGNGKPTTGERLDALEKAGRQHEAWDLSKEADIAGQLGDVRAYIAALEGELRRLAAEVATLPRASCSSCQVTLSSISQPCERCASAMYAMRPIRT